MTLVQVAHYAGAVATLLGIGWNVFTGAVTWIIGWMPDDKWAALIEGQPRLAGLVQFIRTSGTDVPGFVRAVRLMRTGQQPPPNWPAGLSSKPPKGGGALALLLAVSLAVAPIAGCADWRAKHPQVLRDLAIDTKDIPCLIENAPLGPLAAMANCGVVQDLYTLVVDLYSGKAVAVRSASQSGVASLRWVRPEAFADAGADARP